VPASPFLPSGGKASRRKGGGKRAYFPLPRSSRGEKTRPTAISFFEKGRKKERLKLLRKRLDELTGCSAGGGGEERNTRKTASYYP